MNGWIKLHRELLDKPIWKNSSPEHKVILITLLLIADRKEHDDEFNGEKYTVQPGEKITGLEEIAGFCGKGVTVQNVRSALQRFEKLGFSTGISTNKGRLVKIGNWGIYQGDDDTANRQSNKQPTGSQQATNKQPTTNKNIEKEKNKEKVKKDIYGEYDNVRLSAEDIEKLTKEFPTDWQNRIERLSEYMASTGKSYKSHLATIRAWSRKESHDNTGKNTGTESTQEKPGDEPDKYAAFFKA